MMVVWMKPRRITSPRTPPIEIRSPTVKVEPRRMTKYPAIEVTTCCSAKARPAETSPKAVARRVGSLNQIDSSPRIRTTAESRLMPWRDQNFVCRLAWSARPSTRPISPRRSLLPISTTATKASDSSNLRPFSAFTPTQSIPRNCMLLIP